MDIKEICKELNLTQKEIAEAIGMNQKSFNNAVSTNKLSKQAIKAIEILKENIKLKKEIEKIEKIKEIINNP